MTWHGQINRTIWEIEQRLARDPKQFSLRKELLRTHFLQRYEYDRSLHVPRDDRTFLFMQEHRAPGCLLLHGSQGTPAEMRELGNFLYGKGFTVYCPRLARYDLKKRPASWESWVTLGENALTTMLEYSQRTIVAGLSLGATVAILLDRLHRLSGLVLLAPAIYPRLGLKGRLYAVSRRITPTLFYKFAGWNGEAIQLMEHARRTTTEIRTPTLVLQARDDHVISTRGLKALRKALTHAQSEVVLLTRGSHAICRGPAKDDVFERVHAFTQSIRPPRRRRRR